jgi:hypothetical protein
LAAIESGSERWRTMREYQPVDYNPQLPQHCIDIAQPPAAPLPQTKPGRGGTATIAAPTF